MIQKMCVCEFEKVFGRKVYENAIAQNVTFIKQML